MKRCLCLLLALCNLALCSCTHIEQIKTKERNEVCEKNIKDYNRLLRWREIEKAGLLYMDRSLWDDFLKTAEQLKNRGVTIADFRILAAECRAENNTADAVVDFDYFILPSNRIKTQTYRQTWKYSPSGETAGWRVTTPLPDFN